VLYYLEGVSGRDTPWKTYHVGEPLVFKDRVPFVVTFQADGDELAVILDALAPKGAKVP